ncbi:DUF2867 domain-containing protein [Tropicibacter naphthalenivorans]|uniref:DUF2867 domain-containing protein n=1 Tax=Tropicibacter naphthalenivorans TaxID=441103 RepID=A0A0P1GF65_9RHOB|nr:DUF2867 domain-containing protein [Tropicibacter naphthalenivorans]CUH79947.1 hypothetical protein TRN7648_02728 [Tropicibacter naphthalenivorans]SMC76325.1 Protein of unknown function [Tropicibacter naphthalenivorans]
MVAINDVPLLAPEGQLDYHHVQTTMLAQEMTLLQAWAKMQERPLPLLGLAFKVRDGISSLFGVKKIGGFARKPVTEVAVGDKLDFFLVEDVRPDLLVLTERDRHLDVMTCLSTDGRAFSVTSSVKVHNAFGRLYMLPVGIAHRLIVSRMMARLA